MCSNRQPTLCSGFQQASRSEFSAGSRVSTCLSTANTFQDTIQHVAGAAILPSDFASRNAPDCDDLSCQVCTFVKRTEESVARLTTAEDVLSGRTKQKCMALIAIRVFRPPTHPLPSHARNTTIQEVNPHPRSKTERYLNIATIARQ